MTNPRLSIVLFTYQRTAEALHTINALGKFLGYEKELRAWYVADDGSDAEHMDKVLGLLRKRGENILGFHSQRYSPRTGIGWNRGIGIGFQNSDFVMVLEDDWVLQRRFDIHPYIQMLTEREDVGMCRLSGLAVGNNVKIVGHNGHHYLQYYRDCQYAYSGNPHIRHARFMHAYGWYSEEELNPGELELEFDGRFRAKEGPEIWRPTDISGWGIFRHIGEKRYR